MVTFLQQFSPIVQALFATLFTWGVTALGAAFVFVNKTVNRRLLYAGIWRSFNSGRNSR